MLQIVQYQKTGRMSVQELPAPQLQHGGILVRNVVSVVSPGTERTSVETAQASIVGKARSRPDLVKQVMDNMKRDGIRSTYRKVQTRLDNYKELGYSSAGFVLESSVEGFKVGDRVACAGNAHHAQVVFIPRNLGVHIPDGVSFEEAAFTTIASIAMQGVRQSGVKLGEAVAVIGLGLIGLITVQLLKAGGCRVIGLDIVTDNFKLARQLGCDECSLTGPSSMRAVEAFTRGYGTDSTIITAGTSSNEPLDLACRFARRRSRIVVVGSVGMEVPRSPFYEKELELTIASSYGPGRYDDQYEEQGIDYPIGYVRWTMNRNMEAVLDLMHEKKLNVRPLITHRFPIEKGVGAYELITAKKRQKYVGVLIEYGEEVEQKSVGSTNAQLGLLPKSVNRASRTVIGFVGAGNFAQSYLLPHLRGLDVQLEGVATSTPVNARAVGEKFGFSFCTSDPSEILTNERINTVFIATRHDSHAQLITNALKKGKHVFVEKPLAVDADQLATVSKARSKPEVILMVGFNRRFSKPFVEMKEFFKDVREPMVISYRVQAGRLPASHWVYAPGQGGRIVGEACHSIDCMSFLSGAVPIRVFAESVRMPQTGPGSADSVAVNIRFSNGSVGNLLYLTNGDASAGKEYCEVSAGGRTAVMQNFEATVFHNNGKKSRVRYDGSKGHAEEVLHFVNAVSGRSTLEVSFESARATTSATFAILESLRKGTPVDV